MIFIKDKSYYVENVHNLNSEIKEIISYINIKIKKLPLTDILGRPDELETLIYIMFRLNMHSFRAIGDFASKCDNVRNINCLLRTMCETTFDIGYLSVNKDGALEKYLQYGEYLNLRRKRDMFKVNKKITTIKDEIEKEDLSRIDREIKEYKEKHKGSIFYWSGEQPIARAELLDSNNEYRILDIDNFYSSLYYLIFSQSSNFVHSNIQGINRSISLRGTNVGYKNVSFRDIPNVDIQFYSLYYSILVFLATMKIISVFFRKSQINKYVDEKINYIIEKYNN